MWIWVSVFGLVEGLGMGMELGADVDVDVDLDLVVGRVMDIVWPRNRCYMNV